LARVVKEMRCALLAKTGEKKRQRWPRLLAWARLGLAAVAFGLALFTLRHIPHRVWLPASVIASEWGHLIALVSTPLLVGTLRRWPSRLAFCLALCAVLLYLTPLLRAQAFVRTLPHALQMSFGAVVPRVRPDAPARAKPIVIADLIHAAPPSISPQTLTFQPGLTLDLYRRHDSHVPSPVVVVVHGGYWQVGDSRQLPEIDHYLAQRGYAVAAVNYRKAPTHPFPAARDDVIAGMGYLKTHADELTLDPKRFVLLGRSAGGHLALVVAYSLRSPAVRGVVSLYAPTDLVWSWNNPGNPRVIDAFGLLRSFLGGSPEEKPDVYQAASPLQLAHPEAPPTLLLHGGRDELIWPRQSERLVERLEELKVKHLLISLPWADHGFDANLWGPSGQIYLYVLERFLAAVTRD
jgi:acetyl esterase/lipase